MVKMDKEKKEREKKVLAETTSNLEIKKEEKTTTFILNKNVEKAVNQFVKELKKIGFEGYLKTPQCPDGLFRRIVKPVLISELEKERL